MRQTEQVAKTVEEAIAQGLQVLAVQREDVEVEILEEPGGGIFGIGAKQAKVRLVVKEPNVEKAQKALEDIVRILNLEGTVDMVRNEDSFRFEVSGEDLGLLIGHRGQTLNAIQYVVAIILGKGIEGKKISCTVDVEGYRARRERSLQILAEKTAQRVSTERRSIALDPMLPYERRIIHLALQNHPYVTTTSQGEEPMRKVVITPKEGGRERGKPLGRPGKKGGKQAQERSSRFSRSSTQYRHFSSYSQPDEPGHDKL